MQTRSKSRNKERIEINNDINDIDLLNTKKNRRGKLIKSQEFIRIEDNNNNNNNISAMIEDNKKEENEKEEDNKIEDDKIEDKIEKKGKMTS